MKISYRTNPVIQLLEKGASLELKLRVNDKHLFTPIIKERLVIFLNKHHNELINNIKIITDPFEDAYNRASDKIIELYNEDKINVLSVLSSGVIIHMNFTDLYYFSNTSFILLEFYRDICTTFIEINNNWQNYVFLSDSYSKSWGFNSIDVVNLLTQQIVMRDWFIKHCELEVKFLPPKTKIKHINCKYFNETNSNIQILDSTWFTTLVQSNSFKVHGHFRLQPCGKGMKDRKIIWISDFEKHGYTRHFKRPLNIDETEL